MAARRPPKESDFKMLRRLYAAAGGRRELDCWIDAALAGDSSRRGPKHIGVDKKLVPGLAMMCRIAKAERGMSRHATVKWFVASLRHPTTGRLHVMFGTSESATVARLYRKLKAIKFSDHVLIAHYTKLGLDPSRFTLNPGA